MAASKRQSLNIFDFNGGLNTSDPPQLLAQVSGVPMMSPDLKNVDFVQNSLEKRLGKSRIATPPTVTASFSNGSTAAIQDTAFTTTILYAMPFTTAGAVTLNSIELYLGVEYASSLQADLIAWVYTDNAGSPGSFVSDLGRTKINSLASPQIITLSTTSAVALTGATNYWVVIDIYLPVVSLAGTLHVGYSSGSLGKIKPSGSWTAGGVNYYYKAFADTVSTATQGLYDFRSGTSSIFQNIMTAISGVLYYKTSGTWTSLKTGLGVGQNKLFDFATAANMLFSTDYATSTNQVWDAASTSTQAHGYRLSPRYVASGTPQAATISSTSGSTLTMAANQNATGLYKGKIITLTGGATSYPETAVIRSFVTTGLQGSATYYVTSIVLADLPLQTDRTAAKWNGVTVAHSAGGSITTATTLTCIKLLPVTQLKSGGYRAGAEISVDLDIATANQKITLSNIAMNSSTDGTQFSSDIPTSATIWFATAAFDPQLDPQNSGSGPSQIYYRIPDEKGAATTYTSLGFNPMVNATTTFDLKKLPLGTEDTLEITYKFPQSYFTGQIDAPRFKFLKVWQGFLVGAGNPENPSTLYLSAQNAPQVWGTAGGVYGAYLPIPLGNNGQIITGLYVWRTYLFVFKNNSVYRMQFTGNLGLSPFFVEPAQGEIGALSHWAIQETPFGVCFLSVKGVAVCTGLQVSLLPESDKVLNLFLASDPDRFNTASMQYSTSLLYSSKSQIWFGVSTTNATIRDLVLVYDYKKRTFWLDDGISGNYFANVGDTNGFPQPYSGDYSAQVFQHDSGYNDNGSAINWYYSTPWIFFRDTTGWKRPYWLWISGEVQTSGTLYIDEYQDFGTTPAVTYTVDMTNARFRVGQNGIQVGSRAKAHRWVLRNAELNVPIKIETLRVDYEDDGEQQ